MTGEAIENEKTQNTRTLEPKTSKSKRVKRKAQSAKRKAHLVSQQIRKSQYTQAEWWAS